jgi:hypothetical protein
MDDTQELDEHGPELLLWQRERVSEGRIRATSTSPETSTAVLICTAGPGVWPGRSDRRRRDRRLAGPHVAWRPPARAVGQERPQLARLSMSSLPSQPKGEVLTPQTRVPLRAAASWAGPTSHPGGRAEGAGPGRARPEVERGTCELLSSPDRQRWPGARATFHRYGFVI